MKTQSTKILHDAYFVSFKSWQTILHLEGKMLPEIPANETTVYLNYFPQKPIEYQIPNKSAVSLKNNSSFAVFKVSIFSKEAQREVFSFKELPSHKVLQLQFVKEGFYSLFYSFAYNQKIERRGIKIVPQPPEQPQIPNNFDPQLRPSWLRPS